MRILRLICLYERHTDRSIPTLVLVVFSIFFVFFYHCDCRRKHLNEYFPLLSEHLTLSRVAFTQQPVNVNPAESTAVNILRPQRSTSPAQLFRDRCMTKRGDTLVCVFSCTTDQPRHNPKCSISCRHFISALGSAFPQSAPLLRLSKKIKYMHVLFRASNTRPSRY